MKKTEWYVFLGAVVFLVVVIGWIVVSTGG
jgi:hypothetical protein